MMMAPTTTIRTPLARVVVAVVMVVLATSCMTVHGAPTPDYVALVQEITGTPSVTTSSVQLVGPNNHVVVCGTYSGNLALDRTTTFSDVSTLPTFFVALFDQQHAVRAFVRSSGNCEARCVDAQMHDNDLFVLGQFASLTWDGSESECYVGGAALNSTLGGDGGFLTHIDLAAAEAAAAAGSETPSETHVIASTAPEEAGGFLELVGLGVQFTVGVALNCRGHCALGLRIADTPLFLTEFNSTTESLPLLIWFRTKAVGTYRPTVRKLTPRDNSYTHGRAVAINSRREANTVLLSGTLASDGVTPVAVMWRLQTVAHFSDSLDVQYAYIIAKNATAAAIIEDINVVNSGIIVALHTTGLATFLSNPWNNHYEHHHETLGSQDAVLCKFNIAGTLQWRRPFGAVGSHATVTDVVTNNAGLLWLVGHFLGPQLQVGDTTITTTTATATNPTVFYSRITFHGDWVGAATIKDSNTIHQDAGFASVDPAGKLYFSWSAQYDSNGGNAGSVALSKAFVAYVDTIKFEAKFPLGNIVFEPDDFIQSSDLAVVTKDVTHHDQDGDGEHKSIGEILSNTTLLIAISLVAAVVFLVVLAGVAYLVYRRRTHSAPQPGDSFGDDDL